MNRKKALMLSGIFVGAVCRGLLLKYAIDYKTEGLQKPSTKTANQEASEIFYGEDASLSNGMRIPKDKILSSEISGNLKKYTVDVSHLPEKILLVIDEGDGQPYLFSGETKDFDLVYKYKGRDLPIWDPAAFENQPKKKSR